MKYPLANSTWDKKEVDAMHKVIASGKFTMGELVQTYEQEFSKLFDSKYAVMVNSGSSANLLTIAALFYKKNNPLKWGDEVIVPAVSWATTYHPLQQYGLHCKFVDIDKQTLNFDLDALKEAISEKTKAIFAVNLLGNPNDFDRINSLIKNKNIYLIEDNCESMAAKYNGKMAGSFGIMGTFSSFFSHHISTMEGGTIITEDEELYHILLSLRSHGWTRHLPKDNYVTGTKSDDEFEESFKFVLPGYNLRPGEIHAAIGLEQLKKLPNIIIERRQNAKIFTELFNNHPYIEIQKEIGESSWFGFSMVLKPNAPIDRNTLVHKLSKAGIDCRPIVSGNFLKNPVLKYYNYSVNRTTPNADLIDSNGFFVGNHHYNLHIEIMMLHKLLK